MFHSYVRLPEGNLPQNKIPKTSTFRRIPPMPHRGLEGQLLRLQKQMVDHLKL